MTDGASTSGSTITTAVTAPNTGSQRGSTNQGNNNNNNRHNQGRNNQTTNNNSQTGNTQNNNLRNNMRNFKGDSEEMHGHVFQCYEERSEDPTQFTKTLEALHAYTKKELKTTNLGSLFGTTPTLPTIPKPAKLDDKADELEQLILREEINQYVSRVKNLQSDMAALHSVIWGQCSEAHKAKIKSLPDYQAKADAYDCAWLIQKIGSVMQTFEETHHPATSMAIVLTSLLNCRQGAEQKISDYVDRLCTLADTIDHHGGKLGNLYPVKDTDSNTSRSLFLASLCIQNADRLRFGTLIATLANQFLLGHNEYPKDLADAQGLLTNYQVPVNHVRRPPGNISTHHSNRSTPDSGTTFAQAAVPAPVPDSRGRLFDDVCCYNCSSMGHYAGDCPTTPNTTNTQTQATDTGTTLLQHAFVLAQHKHQINPNWILLDSQSTISVFNNPAMLTNIRDSGRTLRAITNGGHQDSTKVGDFPNLGEVWFNEQSIANILSLSEVSQVCRVTMDSHDKKALNVHRKDGSVMVFAEHPSGLYVYDSNVTSPNINPYTLVQTVTAQKKLFTPRQVQAADGARALYRKIGRPSEPAFQRILRNNQIHNCPVTPTDATRALAIYGPDVPFHLKWTI